MNVTQIPAKKQRKTRLYEQYQFCVRWQENDSIFFRWYRRDRYAIQFVQELVADGIPESHIRIVQK